MAISAKIPIIELVEEDTGRRLRVLEFNSDTDRQQIKTYIPKWIMQIKDPFWREQFVCGLLYQTVLKIELDPRSFLIAGFDPMAGAFQYIGKIFIDGEPRFEDAIPFVIIPRYEKLTDSEEEPKLTVSAEAQKQEFVST